MSALDTTKRLLWIRAGGRCIICNDYLVLDHLGSSKAIRTIGEVAHNASESSNGPRGASTVRPEDRNDIANLLLLCPNEHTAADTGRLTDPIYTEEYLRERKHAKEAWIKFVTGLDEKLTTTVLRLSGEVRGATALIAQHEAAAVTMNSSQRTPRYLPDHRGVGLTIDLTNIPNAGSPDYWRSCLSQIDSEVERLNSDIKARNTTHLSVFAFGHIPVLVALGNALDDTIATDVYQRHRSTESWFWDDDPAGVGFERSIPDLSSTKAAVLLVNASGTIAHNKLPASVSDLPTISIAPTKPHVPGPHTFRSLETLQSFTLQVQLLLADLELYPVLRHLHVFMAAPVSAAVNLGRVWPRDNAAPHITIYHLANDTYVEAMQLPRQDR